MKKNIIKTIAILLILVASAFTVKATDIGSLTVNWSTNCNPLYTGDTWEVTLAIVHYPSLNSFWICNPNPTIVSNYDARDKEFNVNQSCYDAQAQYLVIANVKLIRNGQTICEGSSRTVMTCYDLYQLEDVYVTCSCD